MNGKPLTDEELRELLESKTFYAYDESRVAKNWRSAKPADTPDESIEEINSEPWISPALCASLEAELVKVFRDDLTIGPDGKSVVLAADWFEPIRQGLLTFYSWDLRELLPALLFGFLRFGVPTVSDSVRLEELIQFLNIGCEGYSDWPAGQGMVDHQKETACLFSESQSHAIRLWLEAVRDSDALSFAYDSEKPSDLDYAIAYWASRAAGNSGDSVRS